MLVLPIQIMCLDCPMLVLEDYFRLLADPTRVDLNDSGAFLTRLLNHLGISLPNKIVVLTSLLTCMLAAGWYISGKLHKNKLNDHPTIL